MYQRDQNLIFDHRNFRGNHLSFYSPYYAEACNEFAVPISAS